MEHNYENICDNQTVCTVQEILFYILDVLWTITIILILIFCQCCPHMLHAKFGANRSNHVGGVRKNKFLIVLF